MRVSEVRVRRDSRLFEELCVALLRRGNTVQFQVNGQSMTPNLMDGDDVTVAPASASELRRGDVVLAENADGLRVHRIDSLNVNLGTLTLRSDTGMAIDPPASRVFGKVVARRHGSEEQRFTAVQTRLVHPVRALARRVSATAKLQLRRLGLLLTGLVVVTLVGSLFLAPAARAQSRSGGHYLYGCPCNCSTRSTDYIFGKSGEQQHHECGQQTGYHDKHNSQRHFRFCDDDRRYRHLDSGHSRGRHKRNDYPHAHGKYAGSKYSHFFDCRLGDRDCAERRS